MYSTVVPFCAGPVARDGGGRLEPNERSRSRQTALPVRADGRVDALAYTSTVLLYSTAVIRRTIRTLCGL